MMEGLAVKQASHAALLLEYGQPAQDAFISCLASSESRLPLQPAPDTCSSSPVDAWWHSAAMLGDWVQSSRSDHPTQDPCFRSRWTFPLSARHLHANSLPSCQPASQPAFALPTATTNERNAMPGHCMRAEKHLRRTLHTPSSLCTCSYASVPNDVARNRPRRFIVCVFSLLVVYLYTTPYYLSVPAFVLP